MLTHRVTLVFFYCIYFIAAVVPYWSVVVAQPLSPVDESEQLTSQDVSKIVALLGGSIDDFSSKTGANLKAEASESNEKSTSPPEADSHAVPKAIPSNTVPSQDDIAQSLSMLNTLVNSGGFSPETLKLFGLNANTPTETTTTTTTTENPNTVGEAQQALALLNALLGSTAGDNTAAASSSSASDAAGLAALLSLASAASTPQQQGTQQQSAADVALLANLLSSTAALGGSAADPSKVKQQDFQSFQNGGLNVDAASSNQLSSILGLLGTLGSLGGSPQPSLFNFGQQQQQQQQSNLLASLLGGGQAQSNSNLLGGLLASASGQQAQRPGLLSSLGTLASVVGSSLAQGDGKPRVRGVDTRLGLGYRFGENADAQVVWEIGPQLFTEPLSNEQKQQILLQQQQQQIQRRQLQHKANRRVHTIHRTTVPTRQPVFTQNPSYSPVSRRHLAVVQNSQLNAPFMDPSHKQYARLYQNAAGQTVRSSPTTLHRTAQQSSYYNMRDPENENQAANYYAKKEGNPRVNRDSQLTDYERWLLMNPNRDQIHQQQLLVNANAPQNNNHKRKDSFIFSKDNSNNIVRVRIQPRQSPRQVQIYQTVSGMNDRRGHENRNPLTPINKLSHRMGSFDSHDSYNPAADDSYSRRNAVVYNPGLREMERQNERQQHLAGVQQQQRRNQNPTDNRRVSNGAVSTLSEWNDKNSFFDVMQNYVLTSLQSEGNNLVKNFFQAREQNEKRQRQSVQPTPPGAPGKHQQQSQHHHQQQSGSAPVPATSSSGIIPSLKGILGLDSAKSIINKLSSKPLKRPTVKPVIRVGDDVSYDDLKLMLNGGTKEEIRHEPSHIVEKGPGQNTEIFIDIENGEVSMRKPFGSMESFIPPPPQELPEDSPKHVFKVLQEQLKEQYEKVKLEQMKEAAKQRRKENIANGMANPNDPIYLASKYFELLEREKDGTE